MNKFHGNMLVILLLEFMRPCFKAKQEIKFFWYKLKLTNYMYHIFGLLQKCKIMF